MTADSLDASLKKAIALIRAGKLEPARHILTAVLQQEPDHEQAWLWISKCFSEPERKRYCFQRVLKTNPQNPIALKALQTLDEATKPKPQPDVPASAETGKAGAQAPAQKPALSGHAQKKQRRLGAWLTFLLSLLIVGLVAVGVWAGLNLLLPKQILITHAELKTHLTQIDVFCGTLSPTESRATYAYVMRCEGYADNGRVQVEVDVYSLQDPAQIDLVLAYVTQLDGDPDPTVMSAVLAHVAALPYRSAHPEQASAWVGANLPLVFNGTLEEDPVTQFGRVRYHLASLTAGKKYLSIGEGVR